MFLFNKPSVILEVHYTVVHLPCQLHCLCFSCEKFVVAEIKILNNSIINSNQEDYKWIKILVSYYFMLSMNLLIPVTCNIKPLTSWI